MRRFSGVVFFLIPLPNPRNLGDIGETGEKLPKRTKNTGNKLKGFALHLSRMTEEEKQEWYQKRRERIRASRASKMDEVREWKQECLHKFSSILLEDNLKLDDPDYQITEITIWKVREFLKQGFLIDDLRTFLVANGHCSEVGWNKLQHHLFRDLKKPENLGQEVLTSSIRTQEIYEKQIKYLERMKKKRPYDVKIPETIAKIAQQLHTTNKDMGAFFLATGDIGKKNKGSTTINLITGVPRPGAQAPTQKTLAQTKDIEIPRVEVLQAQPNSKE